MAEPRADDALARELAWLAPYLDRIAPPAPAPALVDRTLRLAAIELARRPALFPGVAAPVRELPAGFGRELAQLLGHALPALVLGLLWAPLLLWRGPAWLETWLPADLALVLVGAQLVAGLCALGFVSACLPLVAHRRATLRMRGADA